MILSCLFFFIFYQLLTNLVERTETQLYHDEIKICTMLSFFRASLYFLYKNFITLQYRSKSFILLHTINTLFPSSISTAPSSNQAKWPRGSRISSITHTSNPNNKKLHQNPITASFLATNTYHSHQISQANTSSKSHKHKTILTRGKAMKTV